jgi:hypothetical protein
VDHISPSDLYAIRRSYKSFQIIGLESIEIANGIAICGLQKFVFIAFTVHTFSAFPDQFIGYEMQKAR